MAKESEIVKVDLGKIFIDARSGAKISVSHAAQSTKLSANIIECIEQNNFAEIGTSVYVRGYIGIYAKYLNLDAAQLIKLYDSQNPNEEIKIKSSVAYSMREAKRKPTRHSKVLSGIVVIALLIGLFFIYQRIEYFIFPAADPVTEVELAQKVSSPIDILITEAEQAEVVANDALEGLVPGGNSNLESGLLIDLESITGGAATEDNSIPSDTDVGTENETEQAEKPVSDEKKESEESKSNEVSHLTITFSQDCWIKVVDSTGKVLASKTYNAKKGVDVKGIAPFSFDTGNPGAIKNVSLNGNAIDFRQHKTGNITYMIKKD